MPLPPDEPNEEERLEKLSGDEETPFNPGGPIRDDEERDSDDIRPQRLDDTHPSTDTDIEAEDVYEEGVAGAAGTEEPNAGNAVVNYDPDKDERKQK